MIKEIKTLKEYHKNGQLSYIQTIGVLETTYNQNLYKNVKIHVTEGYEYIQMDSTQKYFDNGQLAWELKYDCFGNCLNTHNNSVEYRKNGEAIVY